MDIKVLFSRGSEGIEQIALYVNNGELEIIDTGRTGSVGGLKMARKMQGSPVLSLETNDAETSFPLADLIAVLRPDRFWKEDAKGWRIADWGNLVKELWHETRRYGLNLIHEIIQILQPGDPLQRFFYAASEDMVFENLEYINETVPDAEKRRSKIRFERDEILAVVEKGGLLSGKLEGYCYRPQQADMVKRVIRAFESSEFLMAEAGTGVGKSMAYLIPSIYWSASSGQRVVVTTRTRALQRQLAENDLPLLEKTLPFEFNWQVAYGRGNYLCHDRWNRLQRDLDALSDSERRVAAGIKLWLSRGGNGQLQELHLDNDGITLWNKVSCQRHGCNGPGCTWTKECFLNNARRKLAKADVIVVNHALLLSDVSAEGRILPEYKNLVVDEAHNLDRTAFDKLGVQFSISECSRLLNRLSEKRDRIERGYLASLHSRFPNLTNEIGSLRRQVEFARQKVTDLTSIQITGIKGLNGSRRLRKGMRGIRELALACYEASSALRAIEKGLFELAYELRDHEENEINVLMGEVAETSLSIGAIAESLDMLGPDEVVWVEWDDYRIRLLASAPLQIGEKLEELLYHQLDSAIMVSATLTVGESFSFIKQRLGIDRIDSDRIAEWKTASPFDYDNNCLGLVIKNIQDPGSPSYARSIADSIKIIASNIDKRTLVLFTSKSLLSQTAHILEEETGAWTGRIISQYQDGEYGTLISKLQATNDGILFGTETFWEGVDLPGDMLQCLVVTRLPFRPPGEPLTEAWLEHLKAVGRNGFTDYSLPEAVIRFRQGVGRLIRSETDTGVLVILDRRFCLPPAGMRYSDLFRSSIPVNNITDITSSQLAVELSNWFK